MRRGLIVRLLPLLVLFVSCNTLQEEFERAWQELQTQVQEAAQIGVEDIPDVVEPQQPAPYEFTLDRERYGVDAGGSVSIRYTLPESSTVEVIAKEGWTAVVNESGAEGEIVVTAPDPASPSDITVIATSESGARTAMYLPVMVRDPYTDATRTRVNLLGYYSFKTRWATPENFQKLADAGLTSVTIEGDEPNFFEQVEMAYNAGLKVLPIIGFLTERYERYGSEYTGLDDFVNVMKDHPATLAYHIYDEPSTAAIPSLKIRKERIEQLDPVHPVYINLNPDGSPSALGTDVYRDYIEAFARDCECKFISFDMYPIMPEGKVMGHWHKCLTAVSEVTREYGIPFWAFAASCCIDLEGPTVRAMPTVENLRLQVYNDLAYGAQVVQYFTIMQFSGTSFAPMMYDGNWNETAYDVLKETSLQVQKRGYVFDGCAVEKYRFAGEVPAYGEALYERDLPESIASLTSTGSVMVSFLSNRGNKYIALVNQSYVAKSPVQVTFNDMVYIIGRDGSFTEHGSGSEEFLIDEGDLMIIKTR